MKLSKIKKLQDENAAAEKAATEKAAEEKAAAEEKLLSEGTKETVLEIIWLGDQESYTRNRETWELEGGEERTLTHKLKHGVRHWKWERQYNGQIRQVDYTWESLRGDGKKFASRKEAEEFLKND